MRSPLLEGSQEQVGPSPGLSRGHMLEGGELGWINSNEPADSRIITETHSESLGLAASMAASIFSTD